MTNNDPKNVAKEMLKRGSHISTYTDNHGRSVKGWVIPVTHKNFGSRFPLRPGGWTHTILSDTGEVYQITAHVDQKGSITGYSFSSPNYSSEELKWRLEELLASYYRD